MRIADVHKIDNSIFKTQTHLISDHELHSYILVGPLVIARVSVMQKYQVATKVSTYQ